VKRLELKVPPPVYALALALVMWVVSLIPPHPDVRLAVRVIATCFFAALAIGVMAAALVALLRARTTIDPHDPGRASTLVISGVYRRTRNPMYLAMVLGLMAFAAWLASPFSVLVALAFVPLVTRVQIVPEERALLARFGASYRNYCASVKRWV